MNENKEKIPVIDDRPMTYKDFKTVLDKWEQEDQKNKDDEKDRKVTA